MNKNFLLSVVGALVAGLVIGRYSAPEKTRVEKFTVTSEKENKNESNSSDKVKVVTKIERPNGTKITRTRIEARRESKAITAKETSTKSEETKVIEFRRGVSISALFGLPLDDVAKGIVYGAAFQKQFLGPFSIGGFAFSDLRFGLSVGIEL